MPSAGFATRQETLGYWEITEMAIRTDELILFRSFQNGEALRLGEALFNEDMAPDDRRRAGYELASLLLEHAAANGFYGNLWHAYLADLLVNNENAYSVAAEIRGAVGGTLGEAALHDLGIFRRLYRADFSTPGIALSGDGAPDELAEPLAFIRNYRVERESGHVYNTRIRGRIMSLVEAFDEADGAAGMKAALDEFYRDYGVGRFGLHKAFRVNNSAIEPILNIRHVKLSDLVGYENAKAKLVENTDAFVAGRPANNCLLFGDAGTGKSSSIKAIANEYYDRGLRIIEIYKHQFRELNDVIAQIKNRNYRFIIYMDDLSFEDFEIEYKYLKAVIEGGLEKKPGNVLIYATSNRRHLIRESFQDRDGASFAEKHMSDTMQEKLSLSGRFGLTIYYESPDMEEYQTIVAALAERNGVVMDPDELRMEATRWEMMHGGLSGRTAQQFIDHLLGREKVRE